jgi:fibronectin type III domain protein
VSITAGNRSVRVTFTKSGTTRGSKINNYRARCTSTDGGKARSHEGDKSPIKVGGLTAGKTYSCTVAAHNKVGFGSPSSPSNDFTPTAH